MSPVDRTTPSPEESPVYEAAHLYEVAFSYRDYRAECDALLAWARRATGREQLGAALELGAGPGRHAIELARRGLKATALDLSPAMCRLAEVRAQEAGVALSTACCDMIEFSLETRFDLACLMINSIAHVYTLPDFVRHLRSVARHLEPKGVYILEMMHPGDFVGRGARAQGVGEPWTVKQGDLEVSVRWGSPTDPYDPLTQVFEAHVELVARERGVERRLEETVRMRDWTKTELEAAVTLSGAFVVRELYGDFAPNAPLTAESWRMIAVLQKLV